VTAVEPIITRECSGSGHQSEIGPGRRRLLQVGAAATIALLPGGTRAQDDDPRRMMRPQIGDWLVRLEDDQETTPIASADVMIGDQPILAWAMDPATKLPRDGSRLNQILLLRLDPSTMGEVTKTCAADGLVAYSAICTHQQCSVVGWIEDKQLLHCPCHQSEYDPRQDARVVAGPAPRPLAALPLRTTDGKPQVAGTFVGRVGMDKQV
jgi:rieske iron-sulfur protein